MACSAAQAGINGFNQAPVTEGDSTMVASLAGCGQHSDGAPSSGAASSSENGICIEPQGSAADSDSVVASPVPEPAVFLMMLVGLILVGGIAKHQKPELFRKEE